VSQSGLTLLNWVWQCPCDPCFGVFISTIQGLVHTPTIWFPHLFPNTMPPHIMSHTSNFGHRHDYSVCLLTHYTWELPIEKEERIGCLCVGSHNPKNSPFSLIPLELF